MKNPNLNKFRKERAITGTIRSRLVKNIIRNYCDNNIFDNIEDLTGNLQDELNKHLNFETLVFDVQNVNKTTNGKVSFDEDDVNRVCIFTILNQLHTIV